MGSYGRWDKGSTKGLVCGGRCALIRALEAWLRTVTSDSLGRYGDMKEVGGGMCCFVKVATFDLI